MRTFAKFPQGRTKCPICGTDEDKECVLIGVEGTQEGRIIQAQAYHLDCIDLIQSENNELTYLYQRFERKDGKFIVDMHDECKSCQKITDLNQRGLCIECNERKDK